MGSFLEMYTFVGCFVNIYFYENHLRNIEICVIKMCSFSKEMVRSCHQLMEEYLIDTCPLSRHKVLSAEASVEPASPVGVLDAAAACGSCDTEPIIKRLRSSASDVQEP
jgi:hypothetical protein